MRCQKPQLLMSQLPRQWRHDSLPHLRQQGLLMSRMKPQELRWSLWTPMLHQAGVAVCKTQCQAAGAMYLCLLYGGTAVASPACMPVSASTVSKSGFGLLHITPGLLSGPARLLSAICGCTLTIWV